MAGEIDRILDRIADILRQDKEMLLDGVSWTRRARAGFDMLEMTAPVATGGVLRDGLQARISCRSDLPDCDVHAQLQVWSAPLMVDSFQAAFLTGCWAWRSSYCAGLR